MMESVYVVGSCHQTWEVVRVDNGEWENHCQDLRRKYPAIREFLTPLRQHHELDMAMAVLSVLDGMRMIKDPKDSLPTFLANFARTLLDILDPKEMYHNADLRAEYLEACNRVVGMCSKANISFDIDLPISYWFS
jgi:hypothetical protein